MINNHVRELIDKSKPEPHNVRQKKIQEMFGEMNPANLITEIRTKVQHGVNFDDYEGMEVVQLSKLPSI